MAHKSGHVMIRPRVWRRYERFGISPDRIADVVAFAIDQLEDTAINEFTVVRPGSPGEEADGGPAVPGAR